MATTQNLGITITSNVGGALPGINSVNIGLQGIQTNAYNAASGLSRLQPVTQSITSAFAGLRAEVQRGGANLSQFSVSANGAQRSLVNTARPAGSATNALTNLGRVASDLPFGFIAIQNNLDPLISSFGLLFSGAGGLQGGFKALGQALVGPAGIGLAFSVLSSTTTVLIQKYGSLGNAINALNPFLDNAAKGQAAWTAAQQKAIEPAAKEIANVHLLYAATQDLNVPLEERRQIADKLIKQYPESFKGLNNEKILAGQAAEAYDKLTKSLLAAATVKAAQGFVEENQKALIGLRLEATRLQQRLDDLRKPDTGFISEDPIAVDRKINAAQNDINRNKAKQRDIEAQNAEILAEQLKLIEQYGSVAAGIDETEEKKAKKIKKQKTDLDKQNEIVANLRKSIKDLDAEFLAVGGSVEDLTKDKIRAFGNALGDLAKIGVLPGNNIFDSIKQEADALKNVLNVPPVTLKIPINIDPLPTAANTAAIQSVAAGVSADFSRAFQSANDKAINEILQNGARDAVSGIATGIGKALAGGGISSVFDSFINALASLGEALGKQLIAQGIAIEAFKTSLASLKGVQAIVAGGALIAASAAFRAIAKGGVASFATGGGVVAGPQLAVIGDNPGREEYVIPSEVLDKIGGSSQGTLMSRLSVNEFIVWLERGYRNG